MGIFSGKWLGFGCALKVMVGRNFVPVESLPFIGSFSSGYFLALRVDLGQINSPFPFLVFLGLPGFFPFFPIS